MNSDYYRVDLTLKSAIDKAIKKIMPLVMLMYLINYIDRVNIGFAAESMNIDLGLSTAAYGLGAGLFFAGYVLFEVPSNIILHKVGARIWLARIMITWGIISASMSFVHSETGFYVVRVLLGISEAGFVPGVIYLLSIWFPSQVRARMVALFIIAIPFAVVIGAPLSALILEHGDGLFGLPGWRVMFFVEAVPAVLVGIYALMYLPSHPNNATWLTAEEKNSLESALDKEHKNSLKHGPSATLAALKDWRVYAIAMIGFSVNMGGYALSFFLPQVIASFSREMGIEFSLLQIALLTAIPFSAAVIALWFVGKSSDRHDERLLHSAVPLLVGAGAISIALYLPGTTAKMISISIAAAGSYCVLPVFWQLPTKFLTGSAAAAGIGLIGGLANIAGFIAPYMTGVIQTNTGSYKPAMFVVAGVMVVGACVALALRFRPELSNKSH